MTYLNGLASFPSSTVEHADACAASTAAVAQHQQVRPGVWMPLGAVSPLGFVGGLYSPSCSQARPSLSPLLGGLWGSTRAALGSHVAHVRLVIAGEQMSRVDAARVVAAVAREHASRKGLAPELEQQTGDVHRSAFDLDDRSASTVQSTDPRPARAGTTRLIDLLPQSLVEWTLPRAVVAPRVIGHAFHCTSGAPQ